MRKDRFRKRGMALSLAGVMLFSTFTGTTASATLVSNGESEVQYGLWLGDSWYGEYYDEEEEAYKEDWLIYDSDAETDRLYGSATVDIKNMSDWRDVDIRDVNGTRDKAFYFSYIPYTTDEKGNIVAEEPEQITAADGLVITYLGTELQNPEDNPENDDARWAKATRQVTDASIEPVDGKEGLFKIHINAPGYYIISNGELTSDEEGYFENSGAAIHFHVYEYTGLAAREAYYDDGEGKWILDSERDYESDFGGLNLWGRAYAVTGVTNGEENDISLDDIALTYYGEIGEDPRGTYWGETGDTDKEGNPITVEKYYTAKATEATLTVYDQDASLLRFIPDQPGEYLISRQGITDEVSDDNRVIRDQAIRITVDSNRAGFFKDAGNYSGQNLLTTEWDNCYRPAYVSGQAKLAFYYRAPLDENGTSDTFDRLDVWYGDDIHEEIVKDNEGNITIPDKLSDVFSMEPVADNTGWYKITIGELNNNLNVEFIDSLEQNASLNVNYYDNGAYYFKRLGENNFGEVGGIVTEPCIFKMYRADDTGINEVDTEAMEQQFAIYRVIDLGEWNDETREFEYFNWVKDESEFYDPTEGTWLPNEAYKFMPNNENPERVLFTIDEDDESVIYRKSAEHPGYMEIRTVKEGKYALYNEGNADEIFFGFYLPGIGLYSTPERGGGEDGVIDNLILEGKVYQGHAKNAYVLAWTDESDKGSVNANTIEALAVENLAWDDAQQEESYTELEGYVKLDKDNPVTLENEENNVIGYPVTITDTVEKDFTLFMRGERLQAQDDPGLSYDEKYERFDIPVNCIHLEELTVKKAPAKVEYKAGEVFNSDGLVVEAVYEDGETFELAKEDYEISVGEKSATDKLAVTDTAVTISYLGMTVEQPITVKEKAKFDLSKAAWNYKEAFTYDGAQKKVEITGLPEGLTVSYTGNTATEVGTYTAKASFSYDTEKYSAPDTTKLASLQWSIVKKAEETTTPTTPTTPTTTPDPGKQEETVKPAAAGTELQDTTTKAKFTVIETSGGTPAVVYEGTTDAKAKTVTVPATIEVNGVTYEVTEIADNAFKNNKTITKVTIGKNVTKIGKNAFSGCKNLKTVSVGSNVTTIEANAFKGCASLKTVTLPTKTTTIKAGAFNGCKKLKTITIKSTKLTSKTIAKGAFKGLGKGTTIKVPKKKYAAYKKLFKQKGLSSKVKLSKY